MRFGMLCVLLAAHGADPSAGIWKMNVAKSLFENKSRPKAMTVRYEPQADAEVWTFEQVGADGRAEMVSQTLRFDGKDYRCSDLGMEGKPDTVTARRPASGTAEVEYKASGRVIRRVVRTMSADGRQMRLEIRITPVEGQAVERRLVFEKE
jgi:hypothetical protein